MNEYAEKIYNHLKNVGKVSGGNVKAALDLSDTEYKKGKNELKENGLVELGRGRGGTIQLIEGAEIPEEPKKPSKSDIMKIAREEKQATSNAQKHRDRIRAKALEDAEAEFPDSGEIQIQVADVDSGKVYVTVWNETNERAVVKERYVDLDG